MKRESQIKHDYRNYHGRPKRDRGTNISSVGTSKRRVSTTPPTEKRNA